MSLSRRRGTRPQADSPPPGGLTDLDNLVPLCSYHHHWIHDCDTQPEILPDRTLRVVPIPITPAPQRRRPRDLTMGTSPPDLVPAR